MTGFAVAKRTLRTVCGALVPLYLAMITAPAAAQSEPVMGPLPDDQATYTAVWENDYFAGTDRNYTNGLRLSWLSGTKEPDALARFAINLFRPDSENALIRRGFAIGQSIYTPEDTGTAMPLPDQHPYAGYLYGEYSALLQHADSIDMMTIQLGVVGPSAGGEFVQNNWHTLINGETADGWNNQIDDEATISVSFDRQLRKVAFMDEGPIRFDLTPSYGVTAGNLRTNARVGLMARVGQNLQNDYGPPRVRPSLAGAGFFLPADRFNWYLFAGVQGRAVAHDIFLDGSLFRDDDPSVSSNSFTGDVQAGLVTQFGGLEIAYTYVYRAKEFEEQDEPQQFGAVSLSWKR